MKMKRVVLTIFMLLLFASGNRATVPTAEQSRFRDNIVQFLKEEGFTPTINSDDDSVDFNKDGTVYWICVSGGNPFYVEIHRTGLDCKSADMNRVIAAVNEGNKKVKCAKAIRYDSSVAFVIEMYCHSAEEFRYVFYKSLKELDAIKNTVADYYNKNTKD